MGDVAIRVEGIADLRRALRAAEDIESLHEFRDGLKAAAGIVAAEAASRVPVRSGRARASVRATVGGNEAYVQGGKKAVPYYGWLDFGSRTPVSGNPRSVGPWARSGSGPARGRFIYPALDVKAEEVHDAVEKAVDSIFRKANLT